MKENEITTSKQIAEKYVYGKHDALTDGQEIKDMVKDIEKILERAYDLGHRDGRISNKIQKLKTKMYFTEKNGKIIED